MMTVVRWKAPLPRSVIWMIAVWFAAESRARRRARAAPVSSVKVVTERARVSGTPAGEVTKRTSPEITSKRTPRAGRGIPPCEMVTVTTASPPEQIAGAQAEDPGAMLMVLLTVPGRTMSVTAAGNVVDVSRAVRITVVSVTTGLGMTVREFPLIDPLTGTTAWLLELTM